ncbi:MAG: radical SAM protein [Clostridia bacterium]|nr:radical SAM protein [Clostridia bacterium]
MKLNKKLRKYMSERFSQVTHTTLNPAGPGSVRIHLVPPDTADGNIHPSVAIINGSDIIPVNYSWAILLNEFIGAVNEYDGKPITDEDASLIMKKTCKNVKRIFPFASRRKLAGDVQAIMSSFTQIAFGEIPDLPIGYLNIGEYAPYMKAPHRMDIMVSAMTCKGLWHCNQKCVHCYAAGQPLAEEDELSTDEWKRILDRLRASCIPQVTFTGGEPTMRDDLIELITYSRWFVSRLNTNGVRLTRDYCDRLRAAELDSLQITFYSSDRDVHNRLVGVDGFDRTSAGISNALAAGLAVSINTPLCTLNRNYTDTLKFLHEKGVRYVTCSGLITTGNALKEDSERLQLTSDELKEILADAVNFAFSHGMEISFTSPGWIDADCLTSLGINVPTCGACLSNMAVTPGGNAVPCQSWLSSDTLGSMLGDDFDWNTIWNNEKCRKIRDDSARVEGKCPLRR